MIKPDPSKKKLDNKELMNRKVLGPSSVGLSSAAQVVLAQVVLGAAKSVLKHDVFLESSVWTPEQVV